MALFQNFILLITVFLNVSIGVLGALYGNQGISTHHYEKIKEHLDTNPVFCGVLGRHMNIDKITAVQGLSYNQCGTCLRVNSNAEPHKVQYVMALDQGGVGLDINHVSFNALFNNADTGIFGATWSPVDQSLCNGAITGGSYPFYNNPNPNPTNIPPPPTSTQISNPKPTDIYQKECRGDGIWFCFDEGTLAMCAHNQMNKIACSGGLKCRPTTGAASCSY